MAGMGSAAPGMKENRRKYQDNEYVKELGLNWMDFHARQYDPQIGRFLGVDPLAAAQGQEIYSPYAAIGNAPESLVDPNGESPSTAGVIPWTRVTPQMSMGKPRYQGPGADHEADLAGGMVPGDEARAEMLARMQELEQQNQINETIGTDFIGNSIMSAGCDHSQTSVEEGGGASDGDPQSGGGSSSGTWTLSFTGQASDVTYKDDNNKEVTRQIGEGKLSILDADGNTVASYDAISGPGTNGLLPNGEYKATNLTMGGGFADETGLSYKLFLNPTGKSANGFGRTELRIHPTMHYWSGTVDKVKKYTTGPTDGCIGLVGNANAAPFLNYMKTYFQNHNFINLNVNIINNANIKISIRGKSHY